MTVLKNETHFGGVLSLKDVPTPAKIHIGKYEDFSIEFLKCSGINYLDIKKFSMYQMRYIVQEASEIVVSDLMTQEEIEEVLNELGDPRIQNRHEQQQWSRGAVKIYNQQLSLRAKLSLVFKSNQQWFMLELS